jgi:hypothetical protein
MKEMRGARGITLWVLTWTVAGTVLAAPRATDEGLPLRDDVAAVVLANPSGPLATVTVAYPGAVGRPQVEQDLARMAQSAGWGVSPPALQVGKRDTQATATVQRVGQTRYAVWGVVVALRRFNRVTVAVVGDPSPPVAGQQTNRFMEAIWSGNQGLWSCDVAIKDRGFSSVAELCATERPAASEEPAPAAPTKGDEPRGDWRWPAVCGAAAGLAALAYLAVSRLLAGGAER